MKKVLVIAFIAILSGWQCSKDDNAPAESQPVSGTITATANGITGQNGNVCAVMAYSVDWVPGSNAPTVAGLMRTINSDNYSFTENLHQIDSQSPSGISSADMVFEPGTYSVVFYVAAQGSAPSYFTESRITVNGNMTATAPAWSGWTHP